jgi:transcriptional regulator with XRE-family HTH domain
VSQPDAVPEWDTADRMRKALRESRTSVQQMAEYLDVSRRSIGNWLGGRVPPSTRTLRLWAMRTGVSYHWLCHDDDWPCGRPDTAVLAGQRGSNSRGYLPDPFTLAVAA